MLLNYSILCYDNRHAFGGGDSSFNSSIALFKPGHKCLISTFTDNLKSVPYE